MSSIGYESIESAFRDGKIIVALEEWRGNVREYKFYGFQDVQGAMRCYVGKERMSSGVILFCSDVWDENKITQHKFAGMPLGTLKELLQEKKRIQQYLENRDSDVRNSNMDRETISSLILITLDILEGAKDIATIEQIIEERESCSDNQKE